MSHSDLQYSYKTVSSQLLEKNIFTFDVQMVDEDVVNI